MLNQLDECVSDSTSAIVRSVHVPDPQNPLFCLHCLSAIEDEEHRVCPASGRSL